MRTQDSLQECNAYDSFDPREPIYYSGTCALDIQSKEEKFGITISNPSKSTKEQNVSFNDQNPAYSYVVDSMPDPTFGQADLADATLGDFFKRPVKIASYEWGVNDLLFERFNPWQLYFENPRIINRITNFSLLRAKLHVKILINGNGFHYGRALASYIPLEQYDGFTVDRAFFSQDIVQASQRPHFYLDPTTSQGGEMVLPFFYFKNAISIPNEEWRRMGEMTLQSLNNLKHANGATDRVTVSVFAWAEDINLSMPTASEPGALTPQCDEQPLDAQADEYGSGPISKPASLVARWAGALKDAPMLGPYARATSIAASAVENVAKIFGYSRPAILSDIMPYKPTYVGNLANTDAPDTVQRLTLDSKQEVTIDPRVTGLGDTDELAIVPLAMRESYVTTFPWQVSSTTESLLWNSEVTPSMWAENDITDPQEIHMTPSCWVSMPFKNWRGSMEFRFQIVASQYHKGRLKVVWDPYYPQSNEYVTNYTWIVDLAEEKDFTVKVGWGNQLGYCAHDTPGVSSPPYSTSLIGAIPGANANGILSVYVVNELTIPNSTIDNDISVNVFTNMCDDFEVANPSSNQLELYSYFLPPQEASQQRELIEEAGYPYGVAALCARVQEHKDAVNEQVQQNECTDKDLPSGEIANCVAARMSGEASPACQDEERKFPLLSSGYRPLNTQSSEEPMVKGDMENTSEPSKPISTQVDGTMGPGDLDKTDHALDVFFGEQVVSLRQILKRYNYHTTFGSFLTGNRLYKRRANNLPYYRGYAPGGVHSADGVPYNRAKMTTLNWIMPAYTAWRGATRWKYVRAKETTSIAGGGSDLLRQAWMTVRRVATKISGYDESMPAWTGPGTANAIAANNLREMDHTWDGNTATTTVQNPVIEAELPYYSNLRFGMAKEANLTTQTAISYVHELETLSAVNTNAGMHIDAYCSIGEDFSLNFFTGAPIAYYVGPFDPDP